MKKKERIVVFGVPSSAGAWSVGQEKAPARLREQGIVDRLKSRGLNVCDLGDTAVVPYRPDPQNPKQQNIDLVRAVALDTAARLGDILGRDDIPLILGGGCTVTIGVLAAMVARHDRLGLVYFDGDLDFNTPSVSPSGTLDGMVLAHITGKGAPRLSEISTTVPLVPEERVAAFGYNLEAGWIDPYEIESLNHSAIIPFPIAEVRKAPAAASRAAMNRLQRTADCFVLHFDVDAMDGQEFPACDARHKLGLSASDVATALCEFTGNPNCVGVVVTEYNPDLDPTGDCGRKLIDILEAALAERRA